MSLVREIQNNKFLNYVLNGTKHVLARELGLKNLKIAVSETARRAMLVRDAGIREGHGTQNSDLRFPYNYLVVNSFAALSDQQNNFATRKHGQAIPRYESHNFTSKAYFFPFDLGCELHYITDNPDVLFSTVITAGILSSSGGIAFRIAVGEKLQVNVRLELPTEETITIQEEQSGTLPEAHELTANIIVHTHFGFVREVSAMTTQSPVMNITVVNEVGEEEYTETIASEGTERTT